MRSARRINDTWVNAYRYDLKTRVESGGCDAYAVVSAGADGRFRYASGRQYAGAVSTNPDDDIVSCRQ